MEWTEFKTNYKFKKPELRFIEIFRLATIQVGCAATRLQSEVSLGEKTGQATTEGAVLAAVDFAAQDVILHLLHAAMPELPSTPRRTPTRSNCFPRSTGTCRWSLSIQLTAPYITLPVRKIMQLWARLSKTASIRHHALSML